MTAQRTLVLLKPDAVQRQLRGEIIRRIEAKGYDIIALAQRTATAEELAAHYAEHEGKPFYPGLVEYMGSAPLVALVVEGVNAIPGFRSLAGATNPTEAAPGTIRGDLACELDLPVIQNLVHGSDSEESAAREIAIWFPELG
ncbi:MULTISPECIES: nucleoside-diphosphate kinase [unclassified Brachybacterium]|uniref:nucleoside-diphosphate kinase n=1 Tax=unclassified Brachybacterium TaxID=2623841 RepID=UPI000C7F7CCA|nr:MULTISPECIES: nucleoside-diphosphate kinase [unclassified Brachybacterium]PMC75075.1 nucleoside-diphosphate kinase [Brachybacterium sp. UMB0905]